MNPEQTPKPWETARIISLDPPPLESLLDTSHAAETWPQHVVENKFFQEQTAARKDLCDTLDNIFEHLPQPDIDFEEGIAKRYITPEQAAKAYASLADLLESDPEYRRIIFYLPFELLPRKTWHPSEKNLQQASNRFRNAYMEAWKSLLPLYDVRANFVDGDVLEVAHRSGDLPRVVKAAHLIPKLVEKGFMKVQDVIVLMEKSKDSILKDSIADTLPVLADMGLLTEKEMSRMEKSKDQLVYNMARLISTYAKIKKEPSESIPQSITLASVQEKLHEAFSHIEAEQYGDITEKRKSWLKQKKKQEVIENIGQGVNLAIANNELADEILESFLRPEADTESRQALIEGIRKAIESSASSKSQNAQALYTHYKKSLLELWKKNDSRTQETLSKLFRRLYQQKIVEKAELESLHIILPKLAGPFSENLTLMSKETRDIHHMIESLESNSELSQFIYPVVLLFGSRLKGYGEKSADIDLAVFVKPGVSSENQKIIQKLLETHFAHEKVEGEIMEFWLEEKDGQLQVYAPQNSDALLGESHDTHVLFGAAWEGDKNSMRELREKLLVPYFYDTKKVIDERNARSIYLEEIERDALQYRLMHKGYERFFPPYGGIHTPHADEIDGQSMFWDSGYRQLATKLFISRVFLPKISN